MKQLDFDRAFAPTPECIHESILTAFEKGEKNMKFRHKLTSALSAAAALLIVCGVTALGLNGREQPIDNAVAPLNSTLSAQTDSSDVVSIGGRNLPANTEIFANVDPDAFVPWFYSTDEVVFTNPDGAYLHMDFNCTRMEAGSVLDLPLLGAINELGLQLCPECFTLGEMPVHHDGVTACLPYHNDSGQASTLAEAVSGGLKLCRYCMMEVYTAEGDPYMHCREECTTELIKKFIHSASAAGLDACPVCMPPSVDPVTGISAPVIYSIPMPTPSPEDFIARNPDWPVQQVYSTPTPPPMATPTPAPVDAAVEMPAPTPPPIAVNVLNGETGDVISHMSLPSGGRETLYEMAESTPEPSFVDVSETIENTYVMASPTPEPADDIPLLHKVETFYSSAEDAYVHIKADCSAIEGKAVTVSLFQSMRRELKHFCSTCCDNVRAYINPHNPTFHLLGFCCKYPDFEEEKRGSSQTLGSPCEICSMDVYVDGEKIHMRAGCSALTGMQTCPLGSAIENGKWFCGYCFQPDMLRKMNYVYTDAFHGSGLTAEEAAVAHADRIAMLEMRSQPGNICFWIDAADPYYIHSYVWCEKMQLPKEISCREALLSGYGACTLCLEIDKTFEDWIAF